MSNKFTVDFGFSPCRLGMVTAKKGKTDEPKNSSLQDIIKINDNNPVCLIFDKDKITNIINEKLYKSKYLPRFMTITIAPNMNCFHVNDFILTEKFHTKKDKDLRIPCIETNLWDMVFNKLKQQNIQFAGCLEHHKNRPVKHVHIIYNAKNKNRIRIIKKELKEIVGKTYSSIKDDLISSGTHQKVLDYIIKVDENNINKNTQEPEHPKEYVYYLVK